VIVTLGLFRHSDRARAFQAGDVIFSAGDPGGCMYAVLEGSVDIRRNGALLETVGPDQVFGEMEILEEEPRWASAIARTDCRVVPIDKKQFDFLVRNTPNFAMEIMRLAIDRVRRTSETAPI
jgi:CRP/FNR family transcriptional regulator, cyclic AMP receptor protein